MVETRPGQILAVILAALLAPTVLRAEEVAADLAYRVDEAQGHPSVSLTPVEDPPPGVEPIEGAEGVRYLRRPLGPDGQLLLAARLRPEPAWIRVDRDFDGDLRDEEPMHLAGPSTTLSVTVTVQVPLAGEITDVPLRFVHHHTGTSTCLHLTVPVTKEGSVVLAGRLRPVAIMDGDGDLLFDGAADYLLVDVDGDTELDADAASRDRVEAGKPFCMGGAGWTARVCGDGGVVFDRLEGDPPPVHIAWKRFGVAGSGIRAGTEKTPLPELSREYEAAGKRDAAAGATAFSERSRILPRIGQVGSEAAFGFLCRILDTDPDANLKAAAVRAMGYREYRDHAPKLLDLARSSGQTNLRSAAVQALHGMDAPGRRQLLVELLRDASDDSLFSTAARYLGYIAGAEDLALLEELARSETRPTRRRHAYEAATQHRSDPPPADLVRAAAQAEDPWHRALGLEHAFLMELPDARSLALAALSSTEERVLVQAARILGAGADPEAATALLQLSEPPGAAAERIARLLRAVRDEETVDAVVSALGDRRAGVRLRAAEVLGGIPLPSVLDALVTRAGREKDHAVLAALLRALGEQDSAEARRAILDAAGAARKDPDALAAALDALARLGLSDTRVLRFFEKVLDSRDPVDRMLALDAAASTGDPAAADLLLDAVDDREWRVRLVAAGGLGKVRVKRAVPVLIDRLEAEETPRVRSAVEESLFLVTGQGFYDIVELWRKWWAEAGEEFQVPVDVPQRPKDPHAGASVASFYGVPVNSDRIIFVIDQSGSMSSAAGDKTKLERAVEETLAVVKKLPKTARINVILFETSIHPWQKNLVRLGGGTRAELAKHLRSKRPTGGTNLYDGLEMALLTKDVDTIYLLSDGAPGSGKFVQHADILREVEKLNRTRRVAIHCVAVGFDSALLTELAARNDGQYVRR